MSYDRFGKLAAASVAIALGTLAIIIFAVESIGKAMKYADEDIDFWGDEDDF